LNTIKPTTGDPTEFRVLEKRPLAAFALRLSERTFVVLGIE
jgi:hypothetical protein